MINDLKIIKMKKKMIFLDKKNFKKTWGRAPFEKKKKE